MKDYHLTVLVVGFGLAYAILYLVRRDHLYIRQGLFWILVAAFSLGFAIWPTLIDALGGALGIAYPPTLLFLVAIVVLVVDGRAVHGRDHPALPRALECLLATAGTAT